MKLSGIDSCSSKALIMTKSPMVWVPAITARADITIQIAVPPPRMTAWPKFSQASDVQVRVAALS